MNQEEFKQKFDGVDWGMGAMCKCGFYTTDKKEMRNHECEEYKND